MPPSTHTASRAPVGGCAWARALACAYGCARSLRACVHVASRGLCVPVSLRWGWVRSSLSPLSLRSFGLRSSLRSACRLSCVVGCAGGGLLSSWVCTVLAFLRVHSGLLSSLSSVLAFFAPRSSLSLFDSLFELSGLSPSVLRVVRGHSVALSSFGCSLVQSLLDSRSSPLRSFLSLFIVTI